MIKKKKKKKGKREKEKARSEKKIIKKGQLIQKKKESIRYESRIKTNIQSDKFIFIFLDKLIDRFVFIYKHLHIMHHGVVIFIDYMHNFEIMHS